MSLRDTEMGHIPLSLHQLAHLFQAALFNLLVLLRNEAQIMSCASSRTPLSDREFLIQAIVEMSVLNQRMWFLLATHQKICLSWEGQW